MMEPNSLKFWKIEPKSQPKKPPNRYLKYQKIVIKGLLKKEKKLHNIWFEHAIKGRVVTTIVYYLNLSRTTNLDFGIISKLENYIGELGFFYYYYLLIYYYYYYYYYWVHYLFLSVNWP
jgi:hypothetical protein